MTITISKGFTQQEPVPADMYHARFVGHTLIPAETSDDYDRVALEFEIYDEQPEKRAYNGRKLRKKVRDSANPKSNLVKICEALLGRDLREGDTVDLDALIGRFVLLDVSVWTTPEGREVNVIKSIVRPLYTPKVTEDDPFA
ncbi:MAG: hypothetical protein N2045_13955 [Fimbriimonadales bacterium]|nr:hypothetical protein [Fimbriimonadales bacterium]